MDNFDIPAYYVISQELDPEQAVASLRYLDLSLRYLDLTPVMCAIIFNLQHAHLAFSFSTEVIRVPSEPEAHSVAKQIFADTQMPSLIIGTASTLDACYLDGRREEVIKPC